MRDYVVSIKGPLTTPVGGGICSLNVALRQQLDLYVCLRPIQYFKGVPSPLKAPEKTNMVIFRENSEDIYAGIEFEAGSEKAKKIIKILQDDFGVTKIRFPQTSGIGIKPVSREGTERLVRMVMVLMVSGSMNISEIVMAQGRGTFADHGINFLSWNWLPLLPALVVYFISGVAETNRHPFDVVEGESEIVAGHMVEYAGMSFARFWKHPAGSPVSCISFSKAAADCGTLEACFRKMTLPAASCGAMMRAIW